MSESSKSKLFSYFTLSMGFFAALLIVIGLVVSSTVFINLLMWFLSFMSIGFVALILFLAGTEQKPKPSSRQ